MVLSNAERQARYRARLKQGVTPEMIRRARRVLYEQLRRDDPSFPSWGDFVKASRKQRDLKNWINMLPDDPEDDWEGSGLSAEDVELMRKVAAVVRAVKEVRAD